LLLRGDAHGENEKQYLASARDAWPSSGRVRDLPDGKE
jgi:hypothetical protein